MATARPLLLLGLLVASFGGPAGAGGDPEGPSPETTAETAAPARAETTTPARAEPATPALPPRADCLDAAVVALQARYEKVRDLRARFLQVTRPAFTGSFAPDPITSSGSMIVAKPAKMRWEYEEPEKSLVVSDGESLWTYDPAFGEAQRLPMGEGVLSGAAVQFLLGEGDLRREYEISLVSCEGETAVLELSPREPASYEKLRVDVDRGTGAFSRTQVTDLLGNVTVVELFDLETNVDPDPGSFTFVAPEGVSVIELSPTGAPRP